MASSILDLLKKRNPGISLEDARSAMGMAPGATFDMLGNAVPTQEPKPEPAPLLSPMSAAVPAEPQIYREGFDPIAAMDIERNAAHQQSILAPSPKKEITKAKFANAPKQTALQEDMGDLIKDGEPSAEQLAQDAKNKQFEDQVAKEDAAASGGDLDALSEQAKREPASEEPVTPKGPTLADQFAAAQKRKADAEDAAMWSKIGAQLGGALGHQSASVVEGNKNLADVIAKHGGRDLEQLEQKIAFQKQDPQSEYSQAARKFLKEKFNAELPEDISAEQLDKTFFGPALKSFEADQNRQAAVGKLAMEQENKKELQAQKAQDRLDQLREQAELNAPMKQMMADLARERIEATKSNAEVRKDNLIKGQINTAAQKLAFGSGQLVNQAKQDKVRAQKLFNTLHVDPDIPEEDLKKIDPKTLDENGRLMVVESAIELNKLLQGSGTPAASTLKKLVPNNFNMDSNLAKDYVSGKLNPAKQGEFLKTVLSVAQRVKKQSEENLMDVAKQSFGTLSSYKDHNNPEVQDLYRNSLIMNGIDPDAFGEEMKNKASNLKKSGGKPVPKSSGKVHVTNGTETLEIDAKDLEHAIKDGYQKVGE